METLSNGFAYKCVSPCEVEQKGVIRKPGVISSYQVIPSFATVSTVALSFKKHVSYKTLPSIQP